MHPPPRAATTIALLELVYACFMNILLEYAGAATTVVPADLVDMRPARPGSLLAMTLECIGARGDVKFGKIGCDWGLRCID